MKQKLRDLVDNIFIRLIVTWDVLKRSNSSYCEPFLWINSNMRCIETNISNSGKETSDKINSNMRCIETIIESLAGGCTVWLIVTWDVLKQPFNVASTLLFSD